MYKNLSTPALGVTGQSSELIEWTLSYGFRGSDLDLVEFSDRVKVSGLAHARRLFDSAKLRFGSFCLPVVVDAPEEEFQKQLTALEDQAANAAALDCLRAVVHLSPASDERPYHENFEFHRQRLTKVAAVLRPHGVRLGVGFHAAPELRTGKAFEFIHSFEALVVFLSTLNEPLAGALIDPWDMLVAGGKLEEIRKLPAEKIVAVRLADAPQDVPLGDCPATARLLPGETGVIDSAAALAILAELGYDGPVTPWPHASQFVGQKRDAIVRAVGQRMEEVWKAAGLSAGGKLATSAAS